MAYYHAYDFDVVDMS